MLLGCNFSNITTDIINIKDKTITLNYLESSYKISLEDFCSLDTEKQSIKLDEESLKKKISEIASIINKPAVDAKIINNNNFLIEKEVDGIQLNEDTLIQLIKEYLNSGNILEDCTIDIPFTIIKPKLTENILNEIKNTEISSFSTKFNAKDVNRTENLRISTDTLNGTIISPGEVFSLDTKLGDRTVENGYKKAPIFSGGKVVNSLAGGICQTTTTLYNASLFANLGIIERYKHGLPVSYIGKGRDATIYRNIYDLKVKNNTEYPIYIKSYIDKKTSLLTVKIYGYKKDFNIKVTTEKQIKNGKSYYMTYRHLYDLNNTLIKKDLISTDIFK